VGGADEGPDTDRYMGLGSVKYRFVGGADKGVDTDRFETGVRRTSAVSSFTFGRF